ncbi:hypothetical protein L484_005061 [Morus notabilis]|uniref:Uncharacterized protein n=1 Tax=Morus notabilis TaxID=981085 RepID=W9QM83_9ROSA|nr:hypothetical protein L484_005061 [Morus notabilis]
MQVQHKGSCYLEISEPESEGFESDEWEEDEQQIHNQGPSNCLLVININGETKRRIYQPWRKSLIVKVLGKKVVKRLHSHTRNELTNRKQDLLPPIPGIISGGSPYSGFKEISYWSGFFRLFLVHRIE